jgi:hypothetical protein
MSVPDPARKELEAMPLALRALLEAELAAGNEIIEIGHSFPAPPMGAFVKLARPLLTRERKSGDGFDYRARNSSLCSGEITDAARRYFLIEPPSSEATPTSDDGAARASVTATSSASTHFRKSTVIDYEKWHDGVGYDLSALGEMSGEERKSVEAALLARGVCDWRDIETLARLGTPAAVTAIKSAASHPDPEVRNAVIRCAGEMIPEPMRIGILIRQLESATFFAGLGQAIDRVADFHPRPVIEVLFRGVLDRSGDIAVHFAAMLCYIHGQAPEPFDMDQRDFFLRFNTEVRIERENAFRDLCGKIGVDCTLYLKTTDSSVINPLATSDADYTVEIDVRGETLTYCELHRSAHVICIFHDVPCILTRTLSSWYYQVGSGAEKMSSGEKELILNRIATFCRKHHRMAKLTFE